jgi:hypothetical protein
MVALDTMIGALVDKAFSVSIQDQVVVTEILSWPYPE